jgi:hypothetical protein
VPINAARQVEECENIKIVSNLITGSKRGIFKQNVPPNIHFSTVQPTFVDNTAIVSAQQTSTEMLPPRHFCLVNRVDKTANITVKQTSLFTASCRDSTILKDS